MPALAVMVVLVIALAALPIDGGMALVTLRQTKNAADTAAEAAAAALTIPCFGISNTINDHPHIDTIVDTVLQTSMRGSDAAAPDWTGRYLTIAGDVMPGVDPRTQPPPTGACGLSVSVTAHHQDTIAAVLGFGTLSPSADSAALLRWNGGVLALARYGRHTLQAKGLGALEVDGNMYVASLGCKFAQDIGPLFQPDAKRHYPASWVKDDEGGVTATYDSCAPGTGSDGRDILQQPNSGCEDHWGEDTIDSFDLDATGHQFGQLSALDIKGKIIAATKWPLDQGFYTGGNCGGGQRLDTISNPQPGAQHGNEKIYFDLNSADPAGTYTMLDGSALTQDPLSAAVPEPDQNRTYCSGPTGGSVQGGVEVYTPGVYENPVVVGGPNDSVTHGRRQLSAVFEGCRSTDANGNTQTYPGIYIFKQGLEICPATNRTVSSAAEGVMLYSAGPFGGDGPLTQPAPGCPGVGKSTPFIDTAGGFCPPGSRNHTCYENDDQILDAGFYGAGTYGITIGGHGSVSLSAPLTGPYKGILLFQSRTDGANIGLDPYSGALADPPGFDPEHVPGACDHSYYVDRHQPADGVPITPSGGTYTYLSGTPPQPTSAMCPPDAPTGNTGADSASPTRCGTCTMVKPSADQTPDNADISLTGTIYDVYGPMTGDSADELAKFGCWRPEDYPRTPAFGPDTAMTPPVIDDPQTGISSDGTTAQARDFPGCMFPDGKNIPTSGAELPPTALYREPANGSHPWPTCADVAAQDPGLGAMCDHQVPLDELWRVLCSVGTPTSNAGRLQIGQSTCSDDPLELQDYHGSPQIGGNVSITGAAIADVFTTMGGVTANIDVQSTTEVELIEPPAGS